MFKKILKYSLNTHYTNYQPLQTVKPVDCTAVARHGIMLLDGKTLYL